MSDYTGPGMYEILPKHAPNMSFNVWGNAKTAGTPVKIYERTPKAENTHFEIVEAGGEKARPEAGEREYHIIAANSGLYLTMNHTGEIGKVSMEMRPPLDRSSRWRLTHAGNGAFYINSADTDKKVQLNVYYSGKTSGTDVVTWQYYSGENAQFIFKAAWQ